MDLIQELIEQGKAMRRITTDAAYARLLKVTPQTLCQWKLGTIPVPPKRVVTMAKIAGRNPGETVVLWLANSEEPELREAFQQLMLAVEAWQQKPEFEKQALIATEQAAIDGKKLKSDEAWRKRRSAAAGLVLAVLASWTPGSTYAASANDSIGNSYRNSNFDSINIMRS